MPSKFALLTKNSTAAKGEKHDCAVKAVALVCGVDYDMAHKVLAGNGRRARCGTYRPTTFKSIEHLGYKAERVEVPAGAKTVRTLPYAMSRAGLTGTFLVFVAGHVLALVDGKVEDWTQGRQRRIKDVYRITKAEAPKPAPAPKPTKPKSTQTRAYFAGWVVARHGLAAGITPAMVDEVCGLFGDSKTTESRYRLADAWQALRALRDLNVVVPKAPGTTQRRSRAYYAAKAIMGGGLQAGITPAMVGLVDKNYGKPNEAESRTALNNAWQAIRGIEDREAA